MTFKNASDFLARFADYPPERVRMTPAPGTATKKDVLRVDREEGKLCELIDGTLVEKAMGFKECFLAAYLIERMGPFAREHKLGVVLGADGTVELFPGQVRIPDVAYYPWDRLPGRQLPDDPIPELHPDLAVEVISKSNTTREMWQKLKDYFFAGVKVVWYVYPKRKAVEVYTSVDDLTTFNEADALTGGDVLPGFTLPVADIFAAGTGPAA